jgi:hypothetical protein
LSPFVAAAREVQSADSQSGDSQSADATIPAIAVALTDGQGSAITSLSSDLYITNGVHMTVTASMGFSGTVMLSASATDASHAAIGDWNIGFGSGGGTVTLPENGMATAMVSLEADGDVAELTGTLSLTATPTDTSVPPATGNVAVTFNPLVHVSWTIDVNGQGVYDPNHLAANPYKVLAGRSIGIFNCSAPGSCTDVTSGVTSTGLTVHTDGDVTGFPHENGVTAPGQAYIKTLPTAGDMGQFYWHNADTLTNAQHPHVVVK